MKGVEIIQTITICELVKMGIDLGMKNYPIYKNDESLRTEINRKFVNHYWDRSIGFETIELFYHYLNTTFDEIMPYYNQMFESQDVEFNPLYNIELHETFERENSNLASSETSTESTGSSNNTVTSSDHGTSDSEEKRSDYPQYNSDGTFNDDYSSSGGKTSNDTTTTGSTTGHNSASNENTGNSTSNSTENENYTKTTVGSSAGLSFSHAIGQWRQIMINTVEMIILDQKVTDLFSKTW